MTFARLTHASRAATLGLTAILSLGGCAGGWRNGGPPGSEPAARAVSATPAGAAATPAGATAGATMAAGASTVVTAEGVTFTWAGGGNQANLAGSFNNWSMDADPMKKQADGTFTLTKKLDPGKHEYKFVVDGVWKEDTNAKEMVGDPYGGKNAIVNVGDGAGAASTPATAGTPDAAPPSAAATPPATPPAGAGAVGVGKGPVLNNGSVMFAFAGAVQSVFVAGDFNQWSTTADPLVRQADGTWTLVKKLSSGRHAYKFLVNGTTWKTDDGNPESEADAFGGKNSIVVVP